MGGSGSGRWGWHSNKTQVEECHKLTIYFLKPYLRSGYSGIVRWLRGEVENGKIGYSLIGADQPTILRLQYTINPRTERAVQMDYLVRLTTSPLPWGGFRYWFICPLDGCGRRVGCLYLPSGGRYFGCRHCYNLTYESQQEDNWGRVFFDKWAAEMSSEYPGITGRDVRALWEDRPTKNLRRILTEKAFATWINYDKYEGYLSANDLSMQSGLTLEDLKQLEETRLLIPDTKDGRYRPKLVGWGKKLAYLLKAGWAIEEIQAWSKERWKSESPKKWPPERVLNHKMSSS